MVGSISVYDAYTGMIPPLGTHGAKGRFSSESKHPRMIPSLTIITSGLRSSWEWESPHVGFRFESGLLLAVPSQVSHFEVLIAASRSGWNGCFDKGMLLENIMTKCVYMPRLRYLQHITSSHSDFRPNFETLILRIPPVSSCNRTVMRTSFDPWRCACA